MPPWKPDSFQLADRTYTFKQLGRFRLLARIGMRNVYEGIRPVTLPDLFLNDSEATGNVLEVQVALTL